MVMKDGQVIETGLTDQVLDEPTASLDPANRATVLQMIAEAKARGAAIIGIFHDHEVRESVCERELDVTQFTPGPVA